MMCRVFLLYGISRSEYLQEPWRDERDTDEREDECDQGRDDRPEEIRARLLDRYVYRVDLFLLRVEPGLEFFFHRRVSLKHITIIYFILLVVRSSRHSQGELP